MDIEIKYNKLPISENNSVFGVDAVTSCGSKINFDVSVDLYEAGLSRDQMKDIVSWVAPKLVDFFEDLEKRIKDSRR